MTSRQREARAIIREGHLDMLSVGRSAFAECFSCVLPGEQLFRVPGSFSQGEERIVPRKGVQSAAALDHPAGDFAKRILRQEFLHQRKEDVVFLVDVVHKLLNDDLRLFAQFFDGAFGCAFL
jgi:hypothetical protein